MCGTRVLLRPGMLLPAVKVFFCAVLHVQRRGWHDVSHTPLRDVLPRVLGEGSQQLGAPAQHLNEMKT